MSQKLVVDACATCHEVVGEVGYGLIDDGAGGGGLEGKGEVVDTAAVESLGVRDETAVGAEIACAALVGLLVLAGSG